MKPRGSCSCCDVPSHGLTAPSLSCPAIAVQSLLGQVDLAFLGTYALGMFFAGHLGDRVDLRYFLTAGQCRVGGQGGAHIRPRIFLTSLAPSESTMQGWWGAVFSPYCLEW